MPKFTVTAAIKGDGLPVKLACKGVILQNTGASTVYWGWESTITATDDANQGIPLPPGEWRSLSQDHFNLKAPLYFICADSETTNVTFSQNL